MSSKGKSLIIVESPAKIKTLRKFLGPDFLFESSVGHVRDLPERGFGIDIEADFEPTYETLSDKKDVIKKLIAAAKKVETVYLSPDPDREGEAIAWHIANILPEGTKCKRATFNAITKDAVQEALNNPREIDQDLVDAQQARRLLDRIVGYKISPILNRRVQRGKEGTVSAGRVQSVALKLVVDREKEIEAFNPVEYWNIGTTLKLEENGKTFSAALHSIDGKRVEKELVEGQDFALVNNEQLAGDIVAKLNGSKFSITRVDKKEKRRNPVPPFITSTIQQEASRYHGFSALRTMKAAQGLYEGVDLGNDGPEGLITYMRTDSVRIEPEAVEEARTFIKGKYGDDYLPAKPRVFSSKKSAQDAHEAIRPTSLANTPELLEGKLDRDQFLLYCLIWKRFLASQMNPAVYDTVSADIVTDTNLLLRATGSTIKFSGFLIVYEEKSDEDQEVDDPKILPDLAVGAPISLKDVSSEQAFTRPPARFSEASLVKELEKSGVGRPSTYAAIMNKIQSRSYTVKESGRLIPTELGRVIAAMLETSFPMIMNTDFTSGMEDALERVAEGEQNWKELLRDFWKDFFPLVEIAEKEAHVPKIDTEIDCPKCGKPLQKIWSRSRYFLGCSGYPDCDYTTTEQEMKFDKADYAENFDWDQKCYLCQNEMTLRHGRYGPFLGCSKYPDCKGIVNIPKVGEEFIPPEDMPQCPAIGCEGRLSARKSRFGKTFFSCSTFPDCNVIVNDLSKLAEKYPNHERTPYVKKERKGAKGKKAAAKKTRKKPTKPRNMPPVDLTPELGDIVGAKEMPRTQVTKQVWVYIKEHNLQDPKDKRMIIPDAKLAKVFGSDEPMQMFQMTKVLSGHMKKQES